MTPVGHETEARPHTSALIPDRPANDASLLRRFRLRSVSYGGQVAPHDDVHKRGMPGASAPAAACAAKSTRVSNHEYAETPGIPARNGLNGLLRAPPATNSSCHRRQRIGGFAGPGRARKTSADLTPATGARTTRLHRAPTTSFVCASFVRSRAKPALRSHFAPDAAASTASRPNVRDDGQRPSTGRDGENCKSDLGKRRSGIFLQRGLDT